MKVEETEKGEKTAKAILSVPSSTFINVTLDGVVVDRQYYTVSVDSDGNLVIEFTEEYLRTLGEETEFIVNTTNCHFKLVVENK